MAGDSSKKKSGLRKKAKPTIKQCPALNRASHKGKGSQKMVKNGRQIVQTNHGKRMSSRQILDIHGREAHARPRLHQPIPSQYMTR